MPEGHSRIKFHCKNCGHKISVQDKYAGRRGRCPKCKSIIVVPKVRRTDRPASRSNSANLATASNAAPYDLTLLDVPPKDAPSAQPVTGHGVADVASEDVREPEARADQTAPVGRRRLRWPIDIFCYPTSTAGLTILAIVVIIPSLIDIAAGLIGLFGFFILIPGFFIKIVVGLYMYWYLCECIRDSAQGNIRAPDVLVNAPSLGDMFWQTLKVIGCFLLFVGPPGYYFLYIKRTDAVFWSLAAYAVFFFPMGLLAVVMFDSLSGLNPVVIIGSILSTFFQYCGLVILFCAFGFLLTKIGDLTGQSRILGYISQTLGIYWLMVAAHLLGRFYWYYQERLYWEV